MVKITFTHGVLHDNPTIYSVLKARLGREPTHNELVNEVKRILKGNKNV